jgi:hypothetical protein
VQGQRRKGAETTIPTHNVDAKTNCLEKEVQAFVCSRADGKQREEVEPDTFAVHAASFLSAQPR